MKEIERKYLARTRDCSLPTPEDLIHIDQGYIVSNRWLEWRVRRIRVIKARPEDTTGYPPYTTSVKFGNGFVRREYEWAVGERVYKTLAKLVPQWVEKSRATYGGWILDRFVGDLWPLVVVEREAPIEGWEVSIFRNSQGSYWRSKEAVPSGVTLLSDVTDGGQFAVKRLARMTPQEQHELVAGLTLLDEAEHGEECWIA